MKLNRTDYPVKEWAKDLKRPFTKNEIQTNTNAQRC